MRRVLLSAVAALCAIAVFPLLATRAQSGDLEGNQTQAQSVLRNLKNNQINFRATARRDDNHNGNFEYLDMADLNRYSNRTFATVTNRGVGEKHGYYFTVFLPSRATSGRMSVEDDERYFCIVAWPKIYGETGRYIYMIGADHDVATIANDDSRIEGEEALYLSLTLDSLYTNKRYFQAGFVATEIKTPYQSKSDVRIARFRQAESDAIDTMLAILAAQAQYRKARLRDRNNNGFGEYGDLAALRRGGDEAPLLQHPALSIDNGAGCDGNYYYYVFLPGASGGEAAGPELDEKNLCLVAWPVEFARTGSRIFLSGADGKIFYSDNPARIQGPSALWSSLRPDTLFAIPFDYSAVGSGFKILVEKNEFSDSQTIRPDENQRRAVQTARNIVNALYIFRDKRLLDTDHDGTGEFAGLQYLRDSGLIDLPMARPDVAHACGYYFHIFLPTDKKDFGVNDNEKRFCLVAWPQEYKTTGYKLFVLTHNDVVYASSNADKLGGLEALGKGLSLKRIFDEAPFDIHLANDFIEYKE